MDKISVDILVYVFDYLDDIEDLINCYQVCSLWKDLVTRRTKRVKYILAINYQEKVKRLKYFYASNITDTSRETILLDPARPMWNHVIIKSLSDKIFPNLKIIDLTKVPIKRFTRILQRTFTTSETIKGLICGDAGEFNQILAHSSSLEWLSCTDLNGSFIDKHGPKLKQLYCRGQECSRELLRYPENLSNMRMLRLYLDVYNVFRGKPFKNLDTLIVEECDFSTRTFDASVMDMCPNLKNAYLSGRFSEYLVEPKKINENLENLVICAKGEWVIWDRLEPILEKFPKLNRLALRGHFPIRDAYLEKLIQLLPDLTLLHLSSFVFDRQKACSINNVVNKINPQVKVTFSDWSSIEGFNDSIGNDPDEDMRYYEIGLGQGFMQSHFYKRVYELPWLVDRNF